MSSLLFQYDRYLLKRQVFALTGKFRIFDAQENLVLFSEQKMFRLREDIRVYVDEVQDARGADDQGTPDHRLLGGL